MCMLSTNQKKFIHILLISTLILSTFGGIVFGADAEDVKDLGKDFICSGDNSIESDTQGLVGLFVYGSPVAGSLIYFFSRSVTALGFEDWGTSTAKKALKAGWTAPLIIYGLEWVVDLAFGVNFGCLLP